ncbi:hypothetical protein QCA50_003820 [Cerrena zonata]|uniref:NAD(+) diphosphatase n=1 Tax=Cerrena zonata TaxID=2478898 RepID=A0AAW0GFM7_9APHY
MASGAHVNFFAGLPLNRLAWLRTSNPFLNAIVDSPKARWVLYKDGNLLMESDAQESGKLTLSRLTSEDVKPLLGPAPYFAQGKNPGDLADNDAPILQSARIHGPPVAFLGLLEPDTGGKIGNVLPSSDFSAKADPVSIAARIEGSPFFSLDVTKLDKGEVDKTLQQSSIVKAGKTVEFVDGRAAMGHLTQVDSAIFAESRTLVDWNSRTRFCAGCGSPVYSQWAGWKRSCSSLLPWADNTGKEPCPTTSGLHNITFPRSDPVVIAVVVSKDNDKVFLGRNHRWPPGFYSALAGFVEPGESLEDAFERELWEEAAVKVWNIQFHSSQPWPFPANIMAGFYALGDPNELINLDLDNELEDAKWYSREEVLAVLNNQDGSPPFKLPPRNALAGVLIRDWANGKVIVGKQSQGSLEHGQDVHDTSSKPFRNFF